MGDAVTELQSPYFSPQPKPSRYRDERYLDFVRSHPCMNPKCRRPAPSQAHHVDAVDGTGISTKPSDLHTVPLCWECHRMVEDGAKIHGICLDMTKEDFLRAICRLMSEAVLKGIFEKGRT